MHLARCISHCFSAIVHAESESSLAVGFLWLEQYIQGSSQTTEAAGASSVLILDPRALRIAAAALGAYRAPTSWEENDSVAHSGGSVRGRRPLLHQPVAWADSDAPIMRRLDPELDTRGGRGMEAGSVSGKRATHL